MDFSKVCQQSCAVGASYLIGNNESILEEYYYGIRDDGLVVNKDTIYRIASISKTVLAIGLMRLVEQGLINLDEDISTYLGFRVRNPKFQDHKITVKMLTLHTSSIQDGYDDEDSKYDGLIKGYNGLNQTILDVPLKELLTDTNSQYYSENTYGDYPPGENFCYSNFSTGILACIIELVSKEYYVDYMDKYVFIPLGIKGSFKSSHLDLADQENISSFYTKTRVTKKERFLNSKLPIFSLGNNYRGPAGGVFTNIDGLYKIAKSFFDCSILKKETIDYMYQMHWIGNGGSYKAKGIQLKVIDLNSWLFRGHTGSAYGVRSYLFFNLETKLITIFLTNGLLGESESVAWDQIFNATTTYFANKYLKAKQKRLETSKQYLTVLELSNLLEEILTVENDYVIIRNEPFIIMDGLVEVNSFLRNLINGY